MLFFLKFLFKILDLFKFFCVNLIWNLIDLDVCLKVLFKSEGEICKWIQIFVWSICTFSCYWMTLLEWLNVFFILKTSSLLFIVYSFNNCGVLKIIFKHLDLILKVADFMLHFSKWFFLHFHEAIIVLRWFLWHLKEIWKSIIFFLVIECLLIKIDSFWNAVYSWSWFIWRTTRIIIPAMLLWIEIFVISELLKKWSETIHFQI